MTAFEIVTSVLLGAVAGFVLAAEARWRVVGWQRALVGGGVGGIVGGLLAVAFAGGPTWGDLYFHPSVIGAALVGGAGVVALLRLVGDGRVHRHAPRPRPRA